ncbi:trypsin-like peptidase domain-containing protein [Streptosporangium longisporum]|uniref:Trypsin-like peptidase domain-containing protein n=2 Tax=Streptosporangium longisporum TaxID=46187 RepID=A0ABN3XSC1_9ACTN
MGASQTSVALLAATAVALAGCGTERGSRPVGMAASPGSPAPASPGASAEDSPASPRAPSPGTPGSDPGNLENAYERTITRVMPSVVQITTGDDLGSGVVYDTLGHIITNAHVVGSARRFEVTLATGGMPRTARLVDSFELGDLAVIKVDDPTGLRPVVFGDSSRLRVGQVVMAMGNPLGLSGSVTEGIISALGRTVSEPESNGKAGATISGAIQTSAPINPGNSGGALVNLSGEVIGVPTLTAVNPELDNAQAPGIGFAIPSNTVKDIAAQIVKDGRVTNTRRATLGVVVRTVIDMNGQPAGVGVVRVLKNSGAERAGLKAGDLIVSIDGRPTPATQDLSTILATLRPGEDAKVEILRPDGNRSTVAVPLEELSGG